MTKAQSCLTTIRKLSQVLEAVKRMPAKSVLAKVPKYVSGVEILDRAHPAFVFVLEKGACVAATAKACILRLAECADTCPPAMMPMTSVPSGGGRYG
ncbi:hypothetical protein AGR7C_Lc80130 [Agrobacterium deltaense Zutra 3/1]|uniref:Uncharacterized protein n=1 Tax=Agrobacterium deltaense Zutra 3/1 TaxID=1183427 RepID=A0A1S7RZA6_9HYPH|nr:hypothetical protein AGR7C_Lc80130 [Agrobacterium deltaense Zutra 3/1]